MRTSTALGAWFVVACFWGGCSSPPTESQGLARPLGAKCEPEIRQEDYFGGAIRGNPDQSAGLSRRYSKILEVMQEPSLYCRGDVEDEYRLLSVGSFDPRSFAVRVWRNGDDYGLYTASVTERTGDMRLTERTEKRLRREEWASLTAAMQKLDVWFLPPMPLKPAGQGHAVEEGITWILEGRLENMYHVVIRGSGQGGPIFREVSRAFFALAGVKIPTELIEQP